MDLEESDRVEGSKPNYTERHCWYYYPEHTPDDHVMLALGTISSHVSAYVLAT